MELMPTVSLRDFSDSYKKYFNYARLRVVYESRWCLMLEVLGIFAVTQGLLLEAVDADTYS